MKTVSIITPCYNESANVVELTAAVAKVMSQYPNINYEHLFIDNASVDNTVDLLRQQAATDRHIKIIVNIRNFGVYRSPLHALFEATGDVVIPLAADFQDPPELLHTFIEKWRAGFKIVVAVKSRSEEPFLMGLARRTYYRTLSAIAETKLINDFTGFGLYDKAVIDHIKAIGDHYPYFRGLVVDMGYPIALIPYVRPDRKRGFSKNRLYDLYAQAMNGITSFSKFPLRLAVFVGFFTAFLSFLIALGYLIYKLIFWNSFNLGLAPLIIGVFFLGSVQLIFLGIIGEYIGAIHSRLFQRWLVIEKERINFD